MNRKIHLNHSDSITNDRDLFEEVDVDVDGDFNTAVDAPEALEAKVKAKVKAIKDQLNDQLNDSGKAHDRGPQPVFGRTGPRRIVALFETARDCARVSVDIAEAMGEFYSALAASIDDRSKWEEHVREYTSRELSPAEAEAVDEAAVARIRAEAARSEAARAGAFSAMGATAKLAFDSTVGNTDFRKSVSAIAVVAARGLCERTQSKNAERLARLQARLSEAEAVAHEARAKAKAAAKAAD